MRSTIIVLATLLPLVFVSSASVAQDRVPKSIERCSDAVLAWAGLTVDPAIARYTKGGLFSFDKVSWDNVLCEAGSSLGLRNLWVNDEQLIIESYSGAGAVRVSSEIKHDLDFAIEELKDRIAFLKEARRNAEAKLKMPHPDLEAISTEFQAIVADAIE